MNVSSTTCADQSMALIRHAAGTAVGCRPKLQAHPNSSPNPHNKEGCIQDGVQRDEFPASAITGIRILEVVHASILHLNLNFQILILDRGCLPGTSQAFLDGPWRSRCTKMAMSGFRGQGDGGSRRCSVSKCGRFPRGIMRLFRCPTSIVEYP